jgi:hypothetical protein
MPGDIMNQVQQWLRAKYLEREKTHNLVRKYTAEGEVELEPDENHFAPVHLTEFHDFLLRIGADIVRTVADCESAGWLVRMDRIGPPSPAEQRLYCIMPNVLANIGMGIPSGVVQKANPTTSQMPDEVFVSYSHKDKRWRDEFLDHLKPYLRNGSVTAWSDKEIAPGSQWFEEIQRALRRTRVAVLLVTHNFLASDFIHEHELTPLLKEAASSGVRVLWIPVGASSY